MMFSDDSNWDTPTSVKTLNETIFEVSIYAILL